MEPATAVARAVELDDAVLMPTDAEGYAVAARGMLEGARVLGATSPVPSIALTHLCGHAAEAAIKAVLSRAGVPTTELTGLGHQLTKLWARAAAERLPLSFVPPPWLVQLDRVHAAPYHLRYPIGFHVLVLPDLTAMRKGVEELFSIATK